MRKSTWLPDSLARLFGLKAQSSSSLVVDLQSNEGLSLLKSRLLSLKEGESFEGVKQRDGNNFPYLKGWAFRRRVAAALSGQHILVFFNGSIERAVVWVEPDGDPLSVPSSPDPDKEEAAEENAIDLVGEQFLAASFEDDGKIYICRYMNPAW
jgi:hypothetical protein